MEAARPALKPAREHAHDTHKHTTPHREVRRSHNGGAATSSCVLPRQQRGGFAVKTDCQRVLTGADDARVEHGEVLLAGGEGGDAEGATGLGAAAHPPLRRGAGTFGR